jgi:cyanophycinase-like exopeptidase
MSNYLPLGPLVLAGSGEYTPAMDIVDRYLLERIGTQPVLLIATSCAQEGPERMTWWEELGVQHFLNHRVEARPLRICDQADADNPEFADLIAEAGLVWFSGGSAAYLAQAFDGTRCWQALQAANRRGAAVAGASGGLGVLNVNTASASEPPTALGLAAPVRAMAHFDRMEARRPERLEAIIAGLVPGQQVVGTDEDTALVWTGESWQAMGQQRVVVFEKGREKRIFHHGDRIDVLPPPDRALPSAAK